MSSSSSLYRSLGLRLQEQSDEQRRDSGPMLYAVSRAGSA